MNKKNRSPQSPPFPTFGECFHHIVWSIGLGSLAEGLSHQQAVDSPHKDERLDIWASEKNGPPEPKQFEAYIAHALQPFSRSEDLNFIFQMRWAEMLDCHRDTLAEWQQELGMHTQLLVRP